jgi:hypothetical protein
MPPANKRARTGAKEPEGPVIYNKGLELLDKVPDDIDIAQAATCKNISEIVKSSGFKADEVDLYGKYKAKVIDALPPRTCDPVVHSFRGAGIRGHVHERHRHGRQHAFGWQRDAAKDQRVSRKTL